MTGTAAPAASTGGEEARDDEPTAGDTGGQKGGGRKEGVKPIYPCECLYMAEGMFKRMTDRTGAPIAF